MCGRKRHARRRVTMGERDACAGRGTERCADARDDLEWDPERSELRGFLPSPSEDHRIPALQANHVETGERSLEHDGMDRRRVRARALSTSDRNALRVRRDEREDLRTDE